MNPVDKILIEYAKLHVQLQIAQENLQKLVQEKLALEARLKQYEGDAKPAKVQVVDFAAPPVAAE